jgi:hypothetical protein
MRANGVRSLDVSCWLGHRRTILSADPWPDHMPVPAFGPRMVCHYNGRLALRPPHGAGKRTAAAPTSANAATERPRPVAIGVIRGGRTTAVVSPTAPSARSGYPTSLLAIFRCPPMW